MILDERTEFCDATALNTGAAASYLIGDVIDTQIIGLELGISADLWLVIQVDTTATSGGSATGAFHLASDAQAAIAVDGSATYHLSTGAIAVATLVAGYQIMRARLPATPAAERYLGILQTTAVAAFTAGKVNAFLTPTLATTPKHYADASQ
jgi:hypothetical protein